MNLIWKSNEECSVELVTMGNAAVEYNRKIMTINPGEIYLLHPGNKQKYGTGTAGFLHKRFVVLAGPSLQSLLRTTGLRAISMLRPGNRAEVEMLMRRITRLLDTRLNDWELELSASAYRLVALLGREIGSPYPVLIKRAMDFMERNLNRQLWIAEICSFLGISEPYFSHLFRRYVGEAPMQYFQHQRFNWAKRLLSTTSLSIKEIAAITGFDDPLYFSAQFKKYIGKAPSFYRDSEKAAAPSSKALKPDFRSI